MTPLSPRTSIAIEWFRIALITQVVLGHYAMIALPPIPMLDLHRSEDLAIAAFRLMTRFGSQAAYAFVFLSGYFLVPQLATITQAGGTVGPFIARRLRRIYPTLVAAILLTLVCDLAGARLIGAIDLYRTTLNYDAVSALNPWAFIGNLVSLQPTFVAAFGSNGPLWTLGYLVQFYCAGALVAAIAVRSRGLAIAMMGALCIAAAAVRPEWFALALAWAGGGVVRVLPSPGHKTAVGLGIAGVAMIVVANRLPALTSVAVTAVATACIIVALGTMRGEATLPRWAAACSRASFAIYAFHFPLAMLAFAVLQTSGAFQLPGAYPLFIAFAALLAIGTAIGWDRAISQRIAST